MIDDIDNHEILTQLIRNECGDNEYSTNIDNSIDRKNNLRIIKVDAYYNSLNIEKRPKSIDCLIILKCSDGTFILYLIEFKNIKRIIHLHIREIIEKFENTIYQFMEEVFKEIFVNKKYDIKDIHLYLVTDPKKVKSEDKIEKRYKGTKINILLEKKPFKFRGIAKRIEHKIPSPMISPC